MRREMNFSTTRTIGRKAVMMMMMARTIIALMKMIESDDSLFRKCFSLADWSWHFRWSSALSRWKLIYNVQKYEEVISESTYKAVIQHKQWLCSPINFHWRKKEVRWITMTDMVDISIRTEADSSLHVM